MYPQVFRENQPLKMMKHFPWILPIMIFPTKMYKTSAPGADFLYISSWGRLRGKFPKNVGEN
jgi:hypothetical protein